MNKLHSLGINQKAEQRFFIDAVFGKKAVHHSDKPFVVTFIDDSSKAQELECRTGKTGFIRRTKILPFDIVLGHEERWMYPDQKDKTKWVPSATTTTKYYCIRKKTV